MKSSIFNDVIGPVMRGPSSSHTAASHRIGTVFRQLCPPENSKIVVEFHKGGSLATTYEGQGTSMGLITGLLGFDILDPRMKEYKQHSREQNLNLEFKISDYKATNPSTYKIHAVNHDNEAFEMIAVSTGGGMIEILEINGFGVSILGDYYETLVYSVSSSEAEMENFFRKLAKTFQSGAKLLRHNSNKYLFIVKSRLPVSKTVMEIFAGNRDVLWIRQIDPVLPVLSGSEAVLPFDSTEALLKMAGEEKCDLAGLALKYESARAGIDSTEVLALMKDITNHIKHSIDTGMTGKVYEDRILGHQAHFISEAEKDKKIISTPLNKIISYVTAIMESKSSMEIIVAAPTAGSCGALGGAIFAIAEAYNIDSDAVIKAFMTAGLVGVLIADEYTFAAEEGGCQVECGAASGMAAAGLVQLLGGNAVQAINASSMALQNFLGLICDPVADRVEVPCLGKNILAATNALNCAIMSLSGFDPVIPLDEVIEAMILVGNALPREFCCTGTGGLSITPTSRMLHKKLKLS